MRRGSRWRGFGCGIGSQLRRSCWARCGRGRAPIRFIFHSSRRSAPMCFSSWRAFPLPPPFLLPICFTAPPPAPGATPRLWNLALSTYLLPPPILVLASRHDPVALVPFIVLTAATVAIAWRTAAATATVPVAAILATVVMAHWAVHEKLDALIA